MGFPSTKKAFGTKSSGKKQCEFPAIFMNPEETEYGTVFVGEINGYRAVFSPTKEGGKFKLNYANKEGNAEFSVGKAKTHTGSYGEFTSIPFVINDMWYSAVSKTNAKGDYVLLTTSGKAVAPREYTVADSATDQFSVPPEVPEVDGNGHPVDEGSTVIPEAAFTKGSAPSIKTGVIKGGPTNTTINSRGQSVSAPPTAGKPKRYATDSKKPPF